MTDEYLYEKLSAYLLLAINDMGFDDEYSKYLDGEFMKDPDNKLLLELETGISDLYRCYSFLNEYNYGKPFDLDVFTKFLLEHMKIYYKANYDNLRLCAEKFGCIYNESTSKPFSFFYEAVDYLGHVKEENIRQLIDTGLNYYD